MLALAVHFLTIFDANLTTFLTALVLYLIGSGPVKGFGLTLDDWYCHVDVCGVVCRAFPNGIPVCTQSGH